MLLNVGSLCVWYFLGVRCLSLGHGTSDINCTQLSHTIGCFTHNKSQFNHCTWLLPWDYQDEPIICGCDSCVHEHHGKHSPVRPQQCNSSPLLQEQLSASEASCRRFLGGPSTEFGILAPRSCAEEGLKACSILEAQSCSVTMLQLCHSLLLCRAMSSLQPRPKGVNGCCHRWNTSRERDKGSSMPVLRS